MTSENNSEMMVYAAPVGKIMAWQEGMDKPVQIAERGGYKTHISSFAFNGDELFDASSSGEVFTTLENKLIFGVDSPIHHIESVDGRLIAMTSVEQRTESDVSMSEASTMVLSFIDCAAGKTLEKYSVANTQRRLHNIIS